MPKNVHEEPSEVRAEDGHVEVNGPDDVDVAVTPQAAVETANRLLDGAAEAQGHRLLAEEADQRRKRAPREEEK